MPNSPMMRVRQWLIRLLCSVEAIDEWLSEQTFARLRRERDKKVEEARKAGEDWQALGQKLNAEIRFYSEEMESDRSERLLRKARSLDIDPPTPIPRSGKLEDADDNWDLGSFDWVLTRQGRRALRKEIREEQKERRESRLFWASLGFGLIGALTGLLSVILRR